MSATIHEIAKAAGVSIATVSRALNNSAHTVNAETKQRILTIATELGYRPNQAARNLRMDKSSMIGIVTDAEFPGSSSETRHTKAAGEVRFVPPHTPIIIQGLQDTLKQHNYYSVVINAFWDPESEREAIHNLLSHSVDGVIFVETWHRTANAELDLANKPYVHVHRLFETAYQHSVVPDEVYGARLALQHLLELGHRRIGFINGPSEFYSPAERLRGYQVELASAGVAFDPNLVSQGDWRVESGYQGANKLLEQDQTPSAIFAANDRMALGAIYALQDAGYRVPDDVAVVGYDNEEFTSMVRPSITTVALPRYRMGQSAANLLLQLIEKKEGNGENNTESEIRIQGNLIVRQSSCRTFS